jgi:anti-sigma B factor antagonist
MTQQRTRVHVRTTAVKPAGAVADGISVQIPDVTELKLSEAPLADGAILTIAGELDIATVPRIRERLSAIIERGARRIVVDLRGVTFMDSTGLAAFIHAKVQIDDITLVLQRDSYARLIFEVAGLDGVLDVVETLDEATRA